MIRPNPKTATLQTLAGTLDLRNARRTPTDAGLPPFPEPETASPEKRTILVATVCDERIDRIGLESGTQEKTEYRCRGDDPLSAVAELCDTETLSRNQWQTGSRRSCGCHRRRWLRRQGSLRASRARTKWVDAIGDRLVPRHFR